MPHPVDPVKGQPRVAAHDHHIARTQPDALRRRRPVDPAHAEQRIIPKRYRQHRKAEIPFVPVLMHPHPRAFPVEIYQAAVGLPVQPRRAVPQVQHPRRDRRPVAAPRVRAGIAIAGPVRDPPQAPCRRHPHAHRTAPRRNRRNQRGGSHHGTDVVHPIGLLCGRNQPRMNVEPAQMQRRNRPIHRNLRIHPTLCHFQKPEALAAYLTPTYIPPEAGMGRPPRPDLIGIGEQRPQRLCTP